MSIQGRVVSQHKSLYLVDTDRGVVEAASRGLLKRPGRQACAGDRVQIDVIDESPLRGIIRSILPRANVLRRPVVANVDQVLLVVARKEPQVEPGAVDRFLVTTEALDLRTTIVFNKTDLLSPDELCGQQAAATLYERAGYRCLQVSAVKAEGVAQVKDACRGAVSILAGPSGVGKSTLLNSVFPGINLPTGEVSTRTERGVHTTTTTSLLKLGPDSYVADTPGFANVDLPAIDPRDAALCFPEIRRLVGACRFNNCTHRDEPGCAVREAVDRGDIAPSRYASYRTVFAELDERDRLRPSARNQ